ncbi:quinone oxidoreductase family protein [Rhodobacter calidifons]|uniref:NAD(P)-dependent alcohol dehydrogenase n=1 Tax=Rhodobacter calidifons TaxID=2715277 RepID=A0ABX0G1I9_9RHOB|nr:NAD(P)-dependent alcohol dehydrogenase [Rhodobacter calidifons]NHB75160.1 NAD(P)-dependent alcohol dehydrogenase [Rhodobacter calidifons]
MKAAIYTAYGPPETIGFVECPIPAPAAGEVLVRVRAAPVTAGDARLRSGRVPRGLGPMLRLAIGWRRPRVAPGWAFAGEVAGLGAGVTGFATGQRVFGLTGFRGGSHREFLVIRADGPLLPLPESLSPEEGAAFFFGGLTAAEFLIDKARLAPGERLLVCGATGAVGGAAVQIGRHLGAQVSATASPANHALARQLGAGEVTDYRAGTPPGPFDVILDVMGRLGWPGARPLLAPAGRYVQITADLWAMLGAALRPRRQGRRIITGTNKDDLASMQRLVALHQAGGYTPVVGQVLPFAHLARAHQIAESFHKPGNLVVVMPA